MSAVRDLLSPSRLTHVVNIGANPFDAGDGPPYRQMLEAGLCHVTGFEPEREAFHLAQQACGPNESCLPYAVGDGNPHILRVCSAASGMTSLLEPDPIALQVFHSLQPFGEVIERVPIDTRRLDDIDEIEYLDFLKIDIQGSELAVFQNGQCKLAEAVAIQTEVPFVTTYQNQPTLADIESELRRQGFIPHCLAELKKWAVGQFSWKGDFRCGLNQLLEADIVYVRDFTQPDFMTDEQLKQLALVVHHCYGSWDVALRCIELLEHRGAVEMGSSQRYLELINTKAPPYAEPLVFRRGF
jgi:hypothetical protein